MANKYTLNELQMRQALPLSMKVAMAKTRIREWVSYYGTDGVYISFSGGKDSTVLLDLVRSEYPDIEAVFVDVPTQYPELKAFATSFPNVTVIRPQISYMQVVEKYGFPFISKEVSESVMRTRIFLKQVEEGNCDFSKRVWVFCDMCGIDRRSEEGKEIYKRIRNGDIPEEAYQKMPVKVQELFGKVIHKEKGIITDEYSKRYDKSRYNFLLYAPFDISNYCCNVMKKGPAHKFQRETGKHAIIGTMAEESRLRTEHWLKAGCNAFDCNEPISKPLSIWTEQDVLLYIKENNLPICSVYGDVVEDLERAGQLEGQMSLLDFGNYDIDTPPLKTTGCKRTGCVLCGFGAHCKDDTRFVDLHRTHPGLYSLIDKVQNNGVTMREAIDWINEHGNLDIKY